MSREKKDDRDQDRQSTGTLGKRTQNGRVKELTTNVQPPEADLIRNAAAPGSVSDFLRDAALSRAEGTSSLSARDGTLALTMSLNRAGIGLRKCAAALPADRAGAVRAEILATIDEIRSVIAAINT
jgi:hypothetical protein